MTRVRTTGLWLLPAGGVGILLVHGMVLFQLPMDVGAGPAGWATYVLFPLSWVALLVFGVAAAASAAYLWRGDDRSDAVAVSAVDGGLFIGGVVLVAGALWGRAAWGAFWTWEPRLTVTLLLWFMLAGIGLVRGSAKNPAHGRRLGAVVAVLGALNLPLIHWSVSWFRSLQPVELRPLGPSTDIGSVPLVILSLLASLCLVGGLLSVRYRVEGRRRGWNRPAPRPGAGDPIQPSSPRPPAPSP